MISLRGGVLRFDSTSWPRESRLREVKKQVQGYFHANLNYIIISTNFFQPKIWSILQKLTIFHEKWTNDCLFLLFERVIYPPFSTWFRCSQGSRMTYENDPFKQWKYSFLLISRGISWFFVKYGDNDTRFAWQYPLACFFFYLSERYIPRCW